MKLPNGLTPQELRVLQEYRRVEKDELTDEEIGGIKHPHGGGLEPAHTLTSKGYLKAGAEGAGFALTDKAKALLAVNPVPAGTEGESGAAEA